MMYPVYREDGTVGEMSSYAVSLLRNEAMIDPTSAGQMTTDRVCEAIKYCVKQQGERPGGPEAGLPVLTLRGFTGDEDPALRDLLAVNGKLVIEVSAIPEVVEPDVPWMAQLKAEVGA